MGNAPKIPGGGIRGIMKWNGAYPFALFFVTPSPPFISARIVYSSYFHHITPQKWGIFSGESEAKQTQTKVLVFLDIFLASPSTIDMHSQLAAAFRTQKRRRKNISSVPLGRAIFLTTLKDTLEKNDKDPKEGGEDPPRYVVTGLIWVQNHI